ncbi:flagellar hook-associated protein FlgK [Erwinia sp. OLTSP20]|uniref:flagellar hook-associated protein FlgK n=1 Tax=unclassified Erwinia TaxID=2622719 RepID=UPI000C17F7C4|nr:MULTISPECIES: flagellar hook-associated protein FlgK [unclassified Erwinia]PIJ51928.1 flagellar hook-associated protein FlgK [Erwinia sp. OAMSP11]PIJ74803.1 flagellar hook-associated protein FlgK [Erwinia sp. OLSSP12]PIJ85189.1 flagellar hook-associated protein FlgK [Erwinia sp. OLCASP19]PIJ87190.1 flagellar hook-associated protein FlgK [Erwinia sp. OLMTSP26]PIJ88334.1 flagellar hook-associated protein FlgK [Erwinia sp. OLMDSP33]
MSNLINSAMSGLNAAQNALSTTSNNISNYAVAGYSRQSIMLAQAKSTLAGAQFYGNGVTTAGVNREYDRFISAQLRGATAINSGLATQYDQVSNIDNLLADSTTSISSSIQSFFSSVQNVVNSADDPSARTTLLGSAADLVNRFKTTDDYLRGLDASVNTSIASNVDQINTYSSQIANLNNQIARLKGAGAGNAPNDLLDQRDQLVNQLNQLVGVNVSQQDGGSYIISTAAGVNLVQGDSYNKLAAVPSAKETDRLTVASVDPITGATSEIAEKYLNSGSLGGVIQFRSQNLDPARNQLNQLALTLADSFNIQHEQGYDAHGAKGEAFFNFGSAALVGNSKNSGMASLSASYTDSSAVTSSDYQIDFDGSQWNVTRLSDNSTVSVTSGKDGNGNPTLSFDGLQIRISGQAAARDSFLLKPVSNVIAGMGVNVTDESQIAAAGSQGSGQSDNENATKLLALQTKKVVNGRSTLTQAYASLVASVGNQTDTLKTTSTTQAAVVTQLTSQQQSVSGVNLDEEYANLTRYQQYYTANARVLQTASTTFDALIGALS